MTMSVHIVPPELAIKKKRGGHYVSDDGRFEFCRQETGYRDYYGKPQYNWLLMDLRDNIKTYHQDLRSARSIAAYLVAKEA